MRGIELFNFPAFMKAALEMREMGHEVNNPAERDMALGFNPAEPIDSENNSEVFNLGEAFAWDFQAILKSDAIVLLPNWRSSKGVQAELVLALAMEKKIYYWSATAGMMLNTVLYTYTVEFSQVEESREVLKTIADAHQEELARQDAIDRT